MIVTTAVVLTALIIAGWQLRMWFGGGVLVPGTSVFRTYFDYEHGMADTYGTFDLAWGDQITVRCWSPGSIKCAKYFDIIFFRPGKTSTQPVQSVKINAGEFNATFDAMYNNTDPNTATTLWISGITREQLRQIASAHQAVFDVGKSNNLTLLEYQLAQIRGLLAYTDPLPAFNPFPKDMDSQ